MGTITTDLTTSTTAASAPDADSGTSVLRTSRAVLRDIEPGSLVDCATCGERVKFQAKVRLKQVICNVYSNDRWVRVEHYHDLCYVEAGEPHGPVDTTPPPRVRRTAAANSA